MRDDRAVRRSSRASSKHRDLGRPLNGFRFLLKYAADDAATTTAEMVVLVVARLQDDAVALARAECPRPCSTAVLGSGPAVLEEAEERGLREGQALVL